jgi:hypothetical protein
MISSKPPNATRVARLCKRITVPISRDANTVPRRVDTAIVAVPLSNLIDVAIGCDYAIDAQFGTRSAPQASNHRTKRCGVRTTHWARACARFLGGGAKGACSLLRKLSGASASLQMLALTTADGLLSTPAVLTDVM